MSITNQVSKQYFSDINSGIPTSSKKPKKRYNKKPPFWGWLRAVNEARTRDLKLGKLSLYQLSYYRIVSNQSAKIIFFWKLTCFAF